jgi:hypothetical protein
VVSTLDPAIWRVSGDRASFTVDELEGETVKSRRRRRTDLKIKINPKFRQSKDNVGPNFEINRKVMADMTLNIRSKVMADLQV